MTQIPAAGIVWRYDPNKDADRGKGAFWDRYTLQTLLNVPTYIIPWTTEDEGRIIMIRVTLRSYLEKNYKDIDKEGINECSSVDDLKDVLKRHGLNVSANNKEA